MSDWGTNTSWCGGESINDNTLSLLPKARIHVRDCVLLRSPSEDMRLASIPTCPCPLYMLPPLDHQVTNQPLYFLLLPFWLMSFFLRCLGIFVALCSRFSSLTSTL
jgi:hypothetical protein